MARAHVVLLLSLPAALSLQREGGVDLDHAEPGCYVRILETSLCANQKLAETYRDWALEEDPASRTAVGCRAVGSRLDLKCGLGFGSVLTTLKKGPRQVEVTPADERARGKRAAQDAKALLMAEAARNAEAEARWRAEGEAQVQRQAEDRESELRRRGQELEQMRAEEAVNAESRKRQDAKRQEEREARARRETDKQLDAELEADARRAAQAEFEVRRAKYEAQKAHVKAQAVYAAVHTQRAQAEAK